MRRLIFFTLIFFCASMESHAANPKNDIEQMGALAGTILACGAENQLRLFEDIISRYISNTSPNEAAEKDTKALYVRTKFGKYMVQKDKKQLGCSETLATFSRMPIFKFELYEDGSLKTPEGKYLLPRGQKAFNPNVRRLYPAPAQQQQPPIRR